jgi:ribosomal protein L9
VIERSHALTHNPSICSIPSFGYLWGAMSETTLVVCSQIAAKRAEEEAAIQAIKDEAQALATALQTLGAIKIAKKVRSTV